TACALSASIPAPPPMSPHDAGDSEGTTPTRYSSMDRPLTVRWQLPLSAVWIVPRSHRVPPLGRHAWSSSVRSALPDAVGTAGPNPTGPAVEATRVAHGPTQLWPWSTRHR